MRALQTASRLAPQRRSVNVPANATKVSSRGLCHCNVSVPKPPGWQPRKPETGAKPGVRPYASVNEEHQNLSFVLQKAKHVSFEDRPVPALQSPHDVIINVQWTGICGSDVHYWDHGEVGPFKVEQPMVLGHESAGVITQVGTRSHRSRWATGWQWSLVFHAVAVSAAVKVATISAMIWLSQRHPQLMGRSPSTTLCPVTSATSCRITSPWKKAPSGA